MYAHGLATLALCEAFGMSKDPSIGAAAQKAVYFIEQAQNQATGGWGRYEPQDAGDTSVFGWQIMALKSASLPACRSIHSPWKTAGNGWPSWRKASTSACTATSLIGKSLPP